MDNLIDKAFCLAIGFFVGFAIIKIFVIPKQYEPKIELHYPQDAYGARIPGTNYIIDGKDTLEIVQSYHYRILDKEERKQAREYIKSIRK